MNIYCFTWTLALTSRELYFPYFCFVLRGLWLFPQYNPSHVLCTSCTSYYKCNYDPTQFGESDIDTLNVNLEAVFYPIFFHLFCHWTSCMHAVVYILLILAFLCIFYFITHNVHTTFTGVWFHLKNLIKTFLHVSSLYCNWLARMMCG